MYKYFFKEKMTITKVIIMICCFLWFVEILYPPLSDVFVNYLAFGPYNDFYGNLVAKPWTLLTSAFLHCPLFNGSYSNIVIMGILHILFNMLALKDFGLLIENRETRKLYVCFIIFAAITSNLFQSYFVNKACVGFSGVLFAMFGYMFIYSKLNGRYTLNKSLVYTCFIWLFLCLFLTGIGNIAHFSGLIFGLIFGYIHYKLIKFKKRNDCYTNVTDDVLLAIKRKRLGNLD